MNNSTTKGQAGFDIDSFYKQCDEMADKAASQSGSVYELYQRNLSKAIDALIVSLPTDQHSEARAVAVEAYDYRSPAQIQQDIQADLDAGYCIHALHPDCCPMGCGDLDARNLVDSDDGYKWHTSMFDVLINDEFDALRFIVQDDIKAIGAKYDAQITEQLAGFKG